VDFMALNKGVEILKIQMSPSPDFYGRELPTPNEFSHAPHRAAQVLGGFGDRIQPFGDRLG